MIRNPQKPAVDLASRKGEFSWVGLVAAGVFAIGLGFLYFSMSSNHSPQPAKSDSVVVKDSSSKSPSPVDQLAESKFSSQTISANDSQIETLSDPASDPTSGTKSDFLQDRQRDIQASLKRTAEPGEVATNQTPAGRLTLVQHQIESGEFGPALETARAATSAKEQGTLLRMIAQAQLAIGDYDGADSTIAMISDPNEQRLARGEQAREESLTGGGSMADFQSLIQLIQNETSGPWFDIDGEGGTISQFQTGVRVDPNGMLTKLTQQEQTNALKQLAQQVRIADLHENMKKKSSLRLVSLTRLEQEVTKRLQNGEPLLRSMKHLAGLQKIQYVFVYPESGEIVIGGPAEGWKINEKGMTVGIESARPVLHLDDLVHTLRIFDKSGLGAFSCSIVPRQEGLKQLKQFVEVSNAKGPLNPAAVSGWAKQMERKLGEQDVVYEGVPRNSRIAKVMVEADYKMKLIGIDKLNPGVEIPSFFDLLPPEQQKAASLDALRWWLTMKYESILHSEDRTVFEIRGSSVRCLSENEMINQLGQRVQTGKTEETNRLFASGFTKQYAELAKQDEVFADLQNIFDLALVAALIHHEHLDQKCQWEKTCFAQQGLYHPQPYQVPQTAMSVVNHRVYRGGHIVAQVAGGVRGDVMAMIKDHQIYQETPRLKSLAPRGVAPELPEGRWWWDAQQ